MANAQVTLKLTPQELQQVVAALDFYTRNIMVAADVDRTVDTSLKLAGDDARRSLRVAMKVKEDIGLK